MYFILLLIDFVVCVSPNVLLRKLQLIIFGVDFSIKSEYFFPRGSNWKFFALSQKLIRESICIPKIASLLHVDREILNMEFFFHKQYGIFIPKRLPTSNSPCSKTNKAIELESKRMEYFIFFAPEYFCIFYYCPYTDSR